MACPHETGVPIQALCEVFQPPPFPLTELNHSQANDTFTLSNCPLLHICVEKVHHINGHPKPVSLVCEWK